MLADQTSEVEGGNDPGADRRNPVMPPFGRQGSDSRLPHEAPACAANRASSFYDEIWRFQSYAAGSGRGVYDPRSTRATTDRHASLQWVLVVHVGSLSVWVGVLESP